MSDTTFPLPLSSKTVAQIEELVARPYPGRLTVTDAAINRAMLRHALRLAARGFLVTSANRAHPEAGTVKNLKRYRKAARRGIPPEERPVSKTAKMPLRSGWQHDASCDLEEVRRQFECYHWRNKKTGEEGDTAIDFAVNLSIVTGARAGYFVLDVDGETGTRRLAELETERGALPRTPTSISGSGSGRHYIFQLPDAVKLYNTAGAFGGVGSCLDIRGERGQIIAAPSLHASGGEYRWAEGLSPDEVPIADAPQWVIDEALRCSKKAQAELGKTSVEDDPEVADDSPEAVQRYRPTGKPITVAAKGLAAHLASIGDGAGLAGFHGALFPAMCSYLHPLNNGPDAPADTLKALLRQRITEATKKSERAKAEIERYLSDDYLDEHIDDARVFIRSVTPQPFADATEAEKACKLPKDATTEQRLAAARRVGVSDFDHEQRDALFAILKTTGLTEAKLKKAAQRARREFVKVEMPAEVKPIAEGWAFVTLRGQVCCAKLPDKAGELPNMMQFNQFMHGPEAIVPVGGELDDRGQPKRAGQVWHDSPEFRTDYDGIGFAPPGAVSLPESRYNMFNGWPELADCSHMSGRELVTACRRYLTHIRCIICNGNVRLYKWMLTYIADMLKNPGKRVRVALCLRGDEGAGKGSLYQVLKSYLDGYYWKVSKTADLVKRFNEELQNKILVVSEEAHHSGDQAASKVLRDMVTAEELACELKFGASYMMDKFFRMIFIANKGAVVAVGEDDRRYTIADASDELVTLKRNDPNAYHAYFGALYREMKDGGLAAFVELVTKRWQFDRSILNETVRTEAHAEHVRANLNPLDRWIVEAVARGEFVDPRGNLSSIALEGDDAICAKRQDESPGVALPYGALIDLFRVCVTDRYAQKDYGSPESIHSALKNLLGAEDEMKQVRAAGASRPRCFVVRDLESIRAALVIRGLIPKGVFGQAQDAPEEGVEGQYDIDAVVKGFRTTKASVTAHQEARGFVQAVMAVLHHPEGTIEQAALAGAARTLHERFEPDHGNVVALRPAARRVRHAPVTLSHAVTVGSVTR